MLAIISAAFFTGLIATVKIWVGASLLSFLIGILCAYLSYERFRIPILSYCIDLLLLVFQGVPFFIQMLIGYFVVPELLGINPSPFFVGMVGLGLCSGAYSAEIVRAGLGGIPRGQWESAHLLGYSSFSTLLYIIAPQALFRVLPALVNEFNAVLKSTAIVSTIGVLELTRVGVNIVSRRLNPGQVYTVIAITYLALTVLLSVCAGAVEKSLKRNGRFSC